MAKSAARTKKGEGIVSRVSRYIKETRAEIERVAWPSREEATRLTLIVLAVTASLALVLALLDFIFAWYIAQVLAFNAFAMGFLVVVLVGGGLWWAFVGRHR